MRRRKRRSRGPGISFFSFQDIIASVTGIMLLITLLMTIQLISRSYAHAENLGVIQDGEALREECGAARRQRDDLHKTIQNAKQALQNLAGQGVITKQQVRHVEKAVSALQNTKKGREKRAAHKREQRQVLERAMVDAQTRGRELESLVAKTRHEAEEEKKTTRVVLLGGDASSKKPYLVECAAEYIAVGRVSDDGVLEELRRFRGTRAVGAFAAWARKKDSRTEYFILMVHPGSVDSQRRIQEELGRAFGEDEPQQRFDLGIDVIWGENRVFEGP